MSIMKRFSGKTVVVTAGTTNEATLRTLSDKQRLGINFVTARDHSQSLAFLVAGEAGEARGCKPFMVVGEPLLEGGEIGWGEGFGVGEEGD